MTSTPTRSGTRTRSSTSCTSSRSSTANDDGIGDFAGLIDKLDYIAELGVNTIWLLPFYPSPRRDDGYDISDYRGVHPDYGTLRRRAAVHRRGARARPARDHRAGDQPHLRPASVVSARAPRASRAPAARNFYVWSDTDTALCRHAHHLPRHREVELDLGSGGERLLLAPLLLAPAGSELRQSARGERACCRCCASGSPSAWTASGSMRCRTWWSAKAPATRTCPRRTQS